uniref:Uncharacterized protein n=1 Tax=Triticum urartu TaxID=4572 RepID=A0A8R7QZQ6_TRIUA
MCSLLHDRKGAAVIASLTREKRHFYDFLALLDAGLVLTVQKKKRLGSMSNENWSSDTHVSLRSIRLFL